jgi:plastocyanin
MAQQTKRSFRPARFLLLFGVLLSACGGYAGAGGSSAAAPGATIIRWAVGATGVQTTVAVGTTVQWQSTDGMTHTVTSGSTPSAFVEMAVPGGGYSSPMIFTTPGTFPYFCSIHGARVQNGTLTVTP